MSLEGKILWITGASGGVASKVRELAEKRGALCLLQSRSGIEPTQRSEVVAADVATEEGAMAAVDRCCARFGRPPDLLCHTAGSVSLSNICRTTLTAWNTQFAANATSAFLALRAFGSNAPEGGAAVCFSSAAAQLGTPNHSAVAAAKGALEALVRSAATDLSGRGIRVNALALGLVDSPMSRQFLQGDRARTSIAAQYPLKRYGSVDEVAEAALWLLSNEASWITGQVIGVDGGYSTLKPRL